MSASKLAAAEKRLASLNKELELELAQSALDIAGIVDPTPISDVLGAALSLYRGDLIGAGLSLISVVPYAGDALGKTAKGARAAKRVNGLRKRIVAAIAEIENLKSVAKKAPPEVVEKGRKAGKTSPKPLENCPPKTKFWRGKPKIEDGNLKEGWKHIEARHVTGNHPDGAGDLFAKGTTRKDLEEAADTVVQKGLRISDPDKRIQTFEKRISINGESDRVRVIVDSTTGKVITMFPARGGK
ncbi:MAG: hypothetical protein M3430_02555 [Acidobacteriota bacterium]|nr:hypothetical protein [Acidobacteriota bacterium]